MNKKIITPPCSKCGYGWQTAPAKYMQLHELACGIRNGSTYASKYEFSVKPKKKISLERCVRKHQIAEIAPHLSIQTLSALGRFWEQDSGNFLYFYPKEFIEARKRMQKYNVNYPVNSPLLSDWGNSKASWSIAYLEMYESLKGIESKVSKAPQRRGLRYLNDIDVGYVKRNTAMNNIFSTNYEYIIHVPYVNWTFKNNQIADFVCCSLEVWLSNWQTSGVKLDDFIMKGHNEPIGGLGG